MKTSCECYFEARLLGFSKKNSFPPSSVLLSLLTRKILNGLLDKFFANVLLTSRNPIEILKATFDCHEETVSTGRYKQTNLVKLGNTSKISRVKL